MSAEPVEFSTQHFIGRCLARLSQRDPSLVESLMSKQRHLSLLKLRHALQSAGLPASKGPGAGPINLWALTLHRKQMRILEGAIWTNFNSVVYLPKSKLDESQNDVVQHTNQLKAEYISDGGYASVYRLIIGDHKFAIKKIGNRKPISKKACLWEIELMLEINTRCPHQNLMCLHDWWTDGQKLFYILSDDGGIPLRELPVTFARTTPHHIWTIHRQMMLGVAALNRAGYLHRDIKPHNVLFAYSRTGEVQIKIIDFGLSCKTASFEERHQSPEPVRFGGTPTYLGPWMWRSWSKIQLQQALAADVWACFATMYALINSHRGPLTGLFSNAEEWREICRTSPDDRIRELMALRIPIFRYQNYAKWITDNLNALQFQKDIDYCLEKLTKIKMQQIQEDHDCRIIDDSSSEDFASSCSSSDNTT